MQKSFEVTQPKNNKGSFPMVIDHIVLRKAVSIKGRQSQTSLSSKFTLEGRLPLGVKAAQSDNEPFDMTQQEAGPVQAVTSRQITSKVIT